MKSPAFQFYPGDWLGSQRVTLLSLAEEGAYIRLLSYCWRTGGIPSDSKECARLIGKGASTTLATTVQRMFEPNPNDPSTLIHSRLEDEREKQEAWARKSAAGGRKSAEMRAEKKLNQKPTKRQPPLRNGSNQTSTLHLQSSSSFSPSGVDDKSSTSTPTPDRVSTKAKAATPEEVEEFAVSAGCLPGQGISFYWKMEGNGWTNGGKQVKDWKAVIRHWFAEGYMPAPTAITEPKTAPKEHHDHDGDLIREGIRQAREELRIVEEGSDELELIV